MKLYRKRNRFLQLLHKLVSRIGLEQTRHILYADRVCSHVFKLFRKCREIFVAVYRTCGVAERSLNVPAFFFCRVYRRFKVARVVERVKYPDDVNAVRDRLLHEVFNHVVGIVTVAENILTAEKHLQLCFLCLCADLSESVPRILVKITQAGVKRGAAPRLKRMVPDRVKLFDYRQHFLCRHSCRRKRLVRIAKHRFAYFNLRHM